MLSDFGMNIARKERIVYCKKNIFFIISISLNEHILRLA